MVFFFQLNFFIQATLLPTLQHLRNREGSLLSQLYEITTQIHSQPTRTEGLFTQYYMQRIGLNSMLFPFPGPTLQSDLSSLLPSKKASISARFFKCLVCKPSHSQLLGGGNVSGESSSSTSSSSTSEEGSVESILQILKKKKSELKYELKNVRKQIRHLEKKKHSKRKEKHKKCAKQTEESLPTIYPKKHKERQKKRAEGPGDISEADMLKINEMENLECLEGASDIPLENMSEKSEPEEKKDDKEKGRASNVLVEDVSLFAGQCFDSYDEFTSLLEKYCSTTYTVVRTQKSWKLQLTPPNPKFPYRRVQITCVNFGEPRKKVIDGSRPRQRYSATGCTFQLHIQYIKKNHVYTITKFVDQHYSHSPSQEAYIYHRQKRKLDPEEQEKYVEKYMMELEVPPRTVKTQIAKESGKYPTTKNLLRYKQTKLESEGRDSEVKKLVDLLEEIKEKDPNSVIKLVYADSEQQTFAPAGKGIIKVIFCQTTAMKKMLEKHGSIVMIDGTYNLTSAQYVLVPFHIIDQHFITRLCGFALLSNETSDVMGAAMEMFADANKDLIGNMRYMVVDKDFVEIAAVAKRFGAVQIIICQWHATQAIDRKIHKISLPSHKQMLKEDLRSLTRQLVQVTSNEEYFAAWNTIVQLGVENEELTSFVQYMTINWHQHREMWCTYKLQEYSLFRTFTNNRAENFNKQLKTFIKRQSPVHTVVKKVLEIAETQARDVALQNVKSAEQVFMPADAKNPLLKEVLATGRGLLSHETLSRLREECEEVQNVPVEHIKAEKNESCCTQKKGHCAFFRNFDLPCRHLLATRRMNDEPLLEESMISNHWLLDQPGKSPQDIKGSQEKIANFAKTLLVRRNETARKSKLNTTSGTMREMALILSQYPESERIQLTHQLELLINAWNNNIKTKIDQDTIKFLLSGRDTLKNKEGEELGLGDLIFSPKKQNKNYKTSGDIPKKRKGPLFKTEKSQLDSKTGLEDWQKDVNKSMQQYGASRLWTRDDFEKLLDTTRSGSAAYLNDNHFIYASALVKQQFPNIQSLQDTLDYKVMGLKRVDPTKSFLQPVHSGAFHWALLTNIPLTKEERSGWNKICLFDSMIQLERDSMTTFKLAPAIEWQVTQLLKSQNLKSIEVICMPCEQQQNSHDCGMYTIANLFSLAHGISPSNITYKGDLRGQFLKMLEAGKSDLFQHEVVTISSSSKIKFMTQYAGKVQKKVPLKTMYRSILPICFCMMPESWDNVVVCDDCERTYHQRCSLLGQTDKGSTIAAKLKTFLCFKCRKPGVYGSGFCVPGLPDRRSEEEVAKKIDLLPSHKLCTYYHIVERQKIEVPCTMHDYRTMEELIVKYDLNSLYHKAGAIYVSIRNFYNSHSSALLDPKLFEDVLPTQLTVFALAIICDITETECPPIWSKNKSIVIGEDLKQIRKENELWVKTIGSHLQELEKKMRALEKLSCTEQKARDLISHLTNNLREADNCISNLNEVLANADTKLATKSQLQWKEETDEKVSFFQTQINALFGQLDMYLSHT